MMLTDVGLGRALDRVGKEDRHPRDDAEDSLSPPGQPARVLRLARSIAILRGPTTLVRRPRLAPQNGEEATHTDAVDALRAREEVREGKRRSCRGDPMCPLAAKPFLDSGPRPVGYACAAEPSDGFPMIIALGENA